MSDSIFRPGGPHKIRRIGTDRYEARIDLPLDSTDMLARQCPATDCSPALFKVKVGTGIPDGPDIAYCPYCRHSEAPNDFATPAQVRYAHSLLEREAVKGFDRMVRETFGLGSSSRKKYGDGFLTMELQYKGAALPSVRRPVDEEFRRDITCPKCGLEHAVFGLACWCPECGADIFTTHVEAELEVVRQMLGDVPRRRELLGRRIAAKDLENCLEDVVSIFEAVMKSQVRRHLSEQGTVDGEGEEFVQKKIRNAFQNIERTEKLLEAEFGFSLSQEVGPEVLEYLGRVFQKRHPITHNLGVVDRKYLETTFAAEAEGRELRVTEDEIREAIERTVSVVSAVHGHFFDE